MNGYAVCMNIKLKQINIFQYFLIKYTYIILYCQSLTRPNRGTPALYMYVEVYSVYWYFGLTMSPSMIKKKKSTEVRKMANIELFVRLTYEPSIFLYKIKNSYLLFWFHFLRFIFFTFFFLLFTSLRFSLSSFKKIINDNFRENWSTSNYWFNFFWISSVYIFERRFIHWFVRST